MEIDVQKTYEYYQLDIEVCTCHGCQNYIQSVAKSYPELVDYLNSIGVDYKKPLNIFCLKIRRIKQYIMKEFNILFLVSGMKILCFKWQVIMYHALHFIQLP